MKFVLFALPLFLLTANADAEVYNIRLGQNATLAAGDVAIVGNGRANSAITCGGQPEQPPLIENQLIEAFAIGRFPGPQQETARLIGRDQALGYICTRDTFMSEIRQAQTEALMRAQQQCREMGYTICAQSNFTNEQYSFQMVGDRPGEYACRVKARVFGRTQ